MSERHQIGDFLYDRTRGSLARMHNGKRLGGEQEEHGKGRGERKLEPQVNALLALLLEHAGDTVSREVINSRIWPDRVVSDDALRAMIRKLRDALGDNARDPHYIRTEPLKGYSLIAPVRYPTTISLEAPNRFFSKPGLVIAGISISVVAAAAFSFWLGSSNADDQNTQIELLTHMSGSEVSPDYTPALNRLVFSHRANKDDFLQLYVKDLTTQQVQRLTWDSADYANAHWSGDGNKLVYSRSEGAQLHHFTANFDPEKGIVEPRQLLSLDSTRRYPVAWATRENAIYFKDSPHPGMPSGLSRLDIETGALTSVTAPNVRGQGDFFARESHSGNLLAILREVEPGKQELLVLDKATGSLLHTRILPTTANRLAWSANDATLSLSSFAGDVQSFDLGSNQFFSHELNHDGVNDVFYVCGTDCLYMRQHNGNFLDLEEQPNPFEQRPLMASHNLDLAGAQDMPLFSLDGRSLYYVEKLGGQTAIKHKVHGSTATTLYSMAGEISIEAMQLSPSGKHLSGLLDGRIFLLDLQRREIQFLTSGADIAVLPQWNAEGQFLEFAKLEKGTPVIYRYSLETGVSKPMLQGYITEKLLADETRLRVDSQLNVWRYRDTGPATKLTVLPSPSPNRWQLRGNWLYYTAHEGNVAIMVRVNIETGKQERRELAKNRFRLNFDLSTSGDRALFVKSLLAESNLVKVVLH